MRERIFLFLLFVPSLVVYALSYFDTVPLVDALSSGFMLGAVTLCPMIGALYFERKESIILSLLIPVVLTLSRAISFEGAERLVVAGLLVSLGLSVLFWAAGRLIKYGYARYRQTTTVG